MIRGRREFPNIRKVSLAHNYDSSPALNANDYGNVNHMFDKRSKNVRIAKILLLILTVFLATYE